MNQTSPADEVIVTPDDSNNEDILEPLDANNESRSQKISGTIWKKQLLEATEYITDLGWAVEFKTKSEDSAVHAKRKIHINLTQSIKYQFYILLHEIGHAILLDLPDYSERYQRFDKKYNTLTYRISLVEEEIDAWNEGETIAISKNWTLDKQFDICRASRLGTYFEWAIKRKQSLKKSKMADVIDNENENQSD